MAQYQISVDSEKVKDLMVRDEGLEELVQEVLNQILEAQATEELCGASFSKSTVSELCKELQVWVDAWNERPLEGQEYPFMIVDAAVIKVRKEEKVRSVSALIVSEINSEGSREILGMRLADFETEVRRCSILSPLPVSPWWSV